MKASYQRLEASERLAVMGAVAIPVSMLLPWYGFKLGSPLSATAFDAFSFAHAALLLVVAAVLVVLSQPSRRWPRPLSEGGLLILAGVWSLLIIGFLVADPPDLIVETLPIGGVRIRYGVFVAAAGAATILVAGLRIRRGEP